MRFVQALAAVLGVAACAAASGGRTTPSDAELRAAFLRQGIRIAPAEVAAIRPDVELALREARAHGIGNSKVDFAAVEVASRLGLDTSGGSNSVRNVVAAFADLLERGACAAAEARPRRSSGRATSTAR